MYIFKKVFEKLCDYVQIPTIIMGDFNYSLESLSEFVYKKYLWRKIKTSAQQLINRPKYTNLHPKSISKWRILKSFYSDHKPIYIDLL